MARNGSGTYSLPAGNPVVTGATISSTWANNTLSDIGTALTQSLAKDGQTTPTANLPMGGFKLTGLAAGSGAGDSVRYEQLFNQGTLTDIASASTTDIGGQLSNFLRVTGTTGITSFGTNYNGPRFLIFSDVVVLTHSSSLVLPGAVNITTAANDALVAIPISGGWQVVSYTRASGISAASGANSDITSLSGLTSPIAETRQIQPLSASVAANALTISASALALEFRSTTLGSGTVSFVKGTPANLVISSGSTLGTVSGQQSRIVVLALNNAGTIELAAVNVSGGNDLTETGLISTTAEGGAGAADSASTIYSTTARSNVAYRVIGYIESTQATAGSWATAPSTIQGRGGQALAAMSSLGYGQTWQDVTGSRAVNTTYYNTTGRPILVAINVSSGTSASGSLFCNAQNVITGSPNWWSGLPSIVFLVPAGASYGTNTVNVSIGSWRELR